MFHLIPEAAAQNLNGTDLTQLNFTDVVYLFFALAILGAGALSIVFILYGGISFILSGGDEGKVKQAIHTIRYAIIGLVIALISLVIVPMIGRLFGIDFNFLDFGTLSDKINSLFEGFKATGGDVNVTTPISSTTVNPDVPIGDLIR